MIRLSTPLLKQLTIVHGNAYEKSIFTLFSTVSVFMTAKEGLLGTTYVLGALGGMDGTNKYFNFDLKNVN